MERERETEKELRIAEEKVEKINSIVINMHIQSMNNQLNLSQNSIKVNE